MLLVLHFKSKVCEIDGSIEGAGGGGAGFLGDSPSSVSRVNDFVTN